jgi:small subunit ribosomal protein S4
MARYHGPVCKLCRREGAKLFLKGERCYSEKCSYTRRPYPPGQHGQARIKLSEYAIRLREKQKVRRIYGVLESQFHLTYEKAVKMKGITGENLLGTLERRLDSVLYRMGLATSRSQGRQIVGHGHIQVNGRKVNIPSFIVKPGDEIAIREASKNNATILAARDATAHAPSPSWMDVDRENLKGRIISTPRRDELTQIPINEQLIVELYSK